MMVLKVTFLIQFFLVVYETVFDNYVYESVTSGIINENTFTIMSDDKDFDLTGFRPKGLFTGTLVATSFIIYLTMLYRNKLKMLICLFVMALLVNGRLALLVSSVTLFLNLLVSYDIKFDNKRLPLLLKFQLLFSFFLIFIFLVLFNLPEIVRSNYFNIFNIETDANLGRLISYFQSIDLFLNYSIIGKLFGATAFNWYGGFICLAFWLFFTFFKGEMLLSEIIASFLTIIILAVQMMCGTITVIM